jgi:predicted RND superfamily exporter protein
LVIAAVLVITAVLAVPFLAMPPDQSASMEPGGAVFTARDTIDRRFVSSVYQIHVITEARGGDILTKDALMELRTNAEALRTDPALAPTLFDYFDPATGREIFGVSTFADLVDEVLPGGLAAADQAMIDRAVAGLIDTFGAQAAELSLSSQTTYDAAAGRWVSPAAITTVLADNDVLGFGNVSVTLGGDTAPEEYARDVVDVLRGDQQATRSWGIAIDVNLTSEEQGRLAGPFIGFTILGVLAIIAVSFRSAWVVAITGAAISSLMVWLKGISNLIGLQDSLILSLIVPIAMISFGVDFAFHAIGRYREEGRLGHPPARAFVAGLAGVIGALALALASDAAAFLSNTASGIDAIVQFGIGAAIALTSAFLLLGVVTPLAVAMLDERIGSGPRGRHPLMRLVGGASLAATVTMATVLMMVYVVPWIGVAALGGFLAVLLVLAAIQSRRRAAPAGEAPARSATGGLTRSVGTTISAVGRSWRWIVPAAAVVTAAAAVVALRIPAEFEVGDFFTNDSDFVVSLAKLDEHVGGRGGEEAMVSIDAPLDDPAAVAAIADFVDGLRRLDTPLLAHDQEGTVVGGGVIDVIEEMQASPVAQAALAQTAGVILTDTDGNGVPDTTDQLLAVYRLARQVGVPFDATHLTLTPNDVRTALWLSEDEAQQATVVTVGLTASGTQQGVSESEDLLRPSLDSLRTRLEAIDPTARVVLTGGPIVRQAELDGITRALQVSLPISVVLCLVIAWVFMRSLRLAIVSTIPIIMTVAWLYALMELLGYAINVVTATIGAVSIGVGIDYAIHFTMRYREELDRAPTPSAAMRQAGEGTGMALVASATSSVVGFGILAFAPMPMFASYGFLTALMIVMALAASLLVLPALLVAITPRRPEPVTVPHPLPGVP